MSSETRSSISELFAHWGPTDVMMSFLPLPDLLPLRLSGTAAANAVNVHIKELLREELLLAISRDYRRSAGLRYRISEPKVEVLVPGDSPSRTQRLETVTVDPAAQGGPFVFVVDVASALPLHVMPRCDVAGLVFLLKTATLWLTSSLQKEADTSKQDDAAELTSTVKVRREFADNLLQSVLELTEVRKGDVEPQSDGATKKAKRKRKSSRTRQSESEEPPADGSIADSARGETASVADIILWPRSCPVYQLLSHWSSKKRFGFKGASSKSKKRHTESAQVEEDVHDVDVRNPENNAAAKAGKPLLLIEQVVGDFAPFFQVREGETRRKRRGRRTKEVESSDEGAVSPWLGRPTPDLHDICYLLDAMSDDRDRFPIAEHPLAVEESARPILQGAVDGAENVGKTPLDSSESNPETGEPEAEPPATVDASDEADQDPFVEQSSPPLQRILQEELDLSRLECTKFLCQTGTFTVSKRHFTGSHLKPTALLTNVTRIHLCHVPDLVRIENGFLERRGSLVAMTLAHLPNLAGIGERFLERCSGLRSMHIIDCPALNVLGAEFLKECDALSSWTLPASITGIGGSFMESCSALRGVNLGHMKISALGSRSLGAAALLSLQLPQSLKFIGDGVLAGSNLRRVDLRHTHCVSIGARFLASSLALETLELPRTLAGIGPKFLSYCSKIQQLDLTETQVRMVGDDFCEGASSLESVRFPSTLIRLPQDNFSRLLGNKTGPVLDLSTTSILSAAIPLQVVDRFLLPRGFKNTMQEIKRDTRTPPSEEEVDSDRENWDWE